MDHLRETPAGTQAKLADLGSRIMTSARNLDQDMASKGMPALTFHEKGSLRLFTPEMEQSRSLIFDALNEMHDLLLGPLDLLYHHGNHNKLVFLHLIQRHDIARTVSKSGGQASFEEIAAKCGLKTTDVRRLLRYAMSFRVFCEPAEGVVGHTASSLALTDDNIDDWAATICDDVWPSASRTVDALSKWPGSDDIRNSGFCLYHDTEKPIYQYLGSDPIKGKRFAGMMAAYTNNSPDESRLLCIGYPWSDLPVGSKVVDMGGSTGHISVTLARQFNHLDFVVQDLPSVIEAAKFDDDVSARVTAMAHDFFITQPVAADVYYFRWIFHNWPDAESVQILRALTPVLKNGAKIVVHDGCLPGRGEQIPLWKERTMREADIAMMELMNSRERELPDWKALFERADARFKFVSMNRPEGSNWAFLQWEWQV